MKRTLILLATGAAITTALAKGSDYPDKPVNMVTPFAAGSDPDVVMRIVGDKLGHLWNQRVTIDNKPGGGGFIVIDHARRARPDGYTLLQLDSEHLVALPHLYKSKSFVTLQHFDPVASLYRTPFFVAVGSESKLRSMKDPIADAKAKPGQIAYGSWGVGSTGHLGGGIHKTGKLRYLAIAATKRLPQLPDVPTMAESGGPAALEVNSFVSLLPKRPAEVVKRKIGADVAKVIADPGIKARFDTFAFEPLAWSPEEIGRQSEAKSNIYGELVQRGNISLD